MPRCEDYPCCGHVEPDGSSFCPTDDGRFPCATCGRLLDKNAPSAVCKGCMAAHLRRDEYLDRDDHDYPEDYDR